MIVKRMAKLGFILAAVTAAASSQAQISLLLASSGLGGELSSTLAVVNETVYTQSPGSPTVSSLAYVVDIPTLSGVGDYLGTGGMLDFSFQLAPSSLQTSSSGGSIDGKWIFTGGTGGYANYLDGSGTLALTYLLTSPTTAMTATTFQGMLAPEPAPCLALGLGAMGLLLRRRRKS